MIRRSILLQILIVSFLTNFIFFVSYSLADLFYYHGDKISKNTEWRGRVFIKGTLYIDKGVELKISPGTKILFKKLDVDNDGVSESLIISSGTIKAVGERENPIMFTSDEINKNWGDWREIQINHARNIHFEYCIFEYGEYALHIHFSEGIIRNCIFRNNADGTRIGNAKLEIKNNLFEKNIGKALNFTSSKLIISRNTIRNNRDGLFVFEKSGETIIDENNIYDNHANIKVGDFFQGKLRIGKTFVNNTLDLQKEISIEKLERPILGAMPNIKDAYIIYNIDTDGFVDGGLGIFNNVAYIPSFDGNVYEVNLDSGSYLKILVNDFTDSVPAIDENNVYILTWDGIIRAIDRKNKKIIWLDKFNPSLKDDHRMASPILYEEYLIAISQGGHFKIINKSNGKVIFDAVFNGEFRATPLIFEKNIFLPSVTGDLYKISLKDFNIHNKKFDVNFYSTPIVYNGLIYLLGSNGKLIGIDVDLNIKKYLELKGHFRYQSPVVFKDKIVLFSLDGYIYEISSDKIDNYKKTDYIFTATPIVYDNIFILVPTFQGELVFFDGVKTFNIGNFGEIQFSPAVYGDKIVFGTRNNKIYAIKIW
ncbi:MAG: right-handed parallel beta-helix repeat-containing protein [Proteobacteria bacterium]|nr:right-handed parallel beta-helix repeat-containing protein [Pseudomonadota bacterium]